MLDELTSFIIILIRLEVAWRAKKKKYMQIWYKDFNFSW